MKFYMAQIENYTQSKCILNNISMWERLNIVKKKKNQQNGIHDKHVINYGKSDLL